VTKFTVDGLDHVHLSVRDRRAAAEWYNRVLGLVVAREHAVWAEDPRGPLFLETPGGRHCLALFAGEPAADGDRTVAFHVAGAAFGQFLDGVDRLGLIDRRGGKVRREDAVDHGGAWSIYFCDPDGNWLELTTYEAPPGPAGA
jgi:catechol 2,3-dioxygenase-like lactoylglutathione lyase family enzyme